MSVKVQRRESVMVALIRLGWSSHGDWCEREPARRAITKIFVGPHAFVCPQWNDRCHYWRHSRRSFGYHRFCSVLGAEIGCTNIVPIARMRDVHSLTCADGGQFVHTVLSVAPRNEQRWRVVRCKHLDCDAGVGERQDIPSRSEARDARPHSPTITPTAASSSLRHHHIFAAGLGSAIASLAPCSTALRNRGRRSPHPQRDCVVQRRDTLGRQSRVAPLAGEVGRRERHASPRRAAGRNSRVFV